MKIIFVSVLTYFTITIVSGQNGNFGNAGMNMGTNSGPTFGTPQSFSTNSNSMGMSMNNFGGQSSLNSLGDLGTATSLSASAALSSGGTLTPDQQFLRVGRLNPSGPASSQTNGAGGQNNNGGGGFQSFDPFANQGGGPQGAGFPNPGQGPMGGGGFNQGNGLNMGQGNGFNMGQGNGFDMGPGNSFNMGQGNNFQNQNQGFGGPGMQGGGFGNNGNPNFGLGDGAEFFNDNGIPAPENNNNNNDPFGNLGLGNIGPLGPVGLQVDGNPFGAMGGFARGPMMGGPLFAGAPFQLGSSMGGFSGFGGGLASPFGGDMGAFGGLGGGLPGFGSGFGFGSPISIGGGAGSMMGGLIFKKR